MNHALRVKNQRNIKKNKKSQLYNLKTSQLHILSVIVFSLLLITCYSSPTHAAAPQKELSKIEKKLKESKQQVKQTIEQEKSILSEVDNINRTIKKKQEELNSYERRISQTLSNIKILEDEITELTDQLETKKQNLKGRLKSLYKQQYSAKALILITAKDYQELINKSKYINLLAYHDKKLMDTFNDQLAEANKKKNELELMRKTLLINRENALKKQQDLKLELTKKDKLLASVRSKRSSYEEMVKELEQSSEKLRKMIEDFERESSSAFKGKGFGRLKGRLPWPVSGDVVIPYGRYNDPQYNITTFKNGIEIKVDNNEQPTAVSGGNVVYADWFKGYGLLLIINHGSGYHTLYGHLSEIFFKSGDIIEGGDTIGKVGDSGVSNVPSLYFEIRHRGKPVNPMQWLKRTRSKKRR